MSSVETVPLLTPRNRRDNKWAVVSLCTTLFLVIIILAILFPAGPHPIAGLSRIPLQYELRQILFLSKYTIEESNPPLIECRRASIDHPYHIKEQDAFVNAKIIPLGSSNNYTILEEHRDNDGNLTLYETGSAQIMLGFSNSIVVNIEGDPCQYKITISLFNSGNIENRCQKSNRWTKISLISTSIFSPTTTQFSSPETRNELYADVIATYDLFSIKRTIRICNDAPFPPPIPSIYCIFKDYLNRRVQERRRRRKENAQSKEK